MSIDIRLAFELPPPSLDFVWTGFLVGTVGALIAPGATGKSYWGLQAAMAIACHSSNGDLLELSPHRPGDVLYLAGEDPTPALIRRVHAIGQHLDSNARDSISAHLRIESMIGQRLDLMDSLQLARLIETSHGCRLIVLDTLSRIHRLDENNNGDMANLIIALEQLATQSGAAVLFLHHVSKSSARDGLLDQQQAARGASALIDNARWCGYLAKMTESEAKRLTDGNGNRVLGTHRMTRFVRFGISKQNYDTTTIEQWYERQEGGVLRPVRLLETANVTKTSQRRDTL